MLGGIDGIWRNIKRIEDELRKLRGRLDVISVGGQIIPITPGTANVPEPVENAVIVGNSTPAWERSVPTPTTGQTLVLTSTDVTPKPHWAEGGGGGQYLQFVYDDTTNPFTFVTDTDGKPIFTLLDVQ